MNSKLPRLVLRLISPLLLAAGVSLASAVTAAANVDALLDSTRQSLNSAPEKSIVTLEQLRELRSTFTKQQDNQYHFFFAASLGIRGLHKERVALVKSIIDGVGDIEFRVKFLYQLSDSYTRLGDYESALSAMNQSMLLLPKVTELGPKVTTLQAAVTFYLSMRAYEEAMIYAERMYALEGHLSNPLSQCYGLANRIDIHFLKGSRERASELIPEAIKTCDVASRKVITLMVKAMNAIDSFDSMQVDQAIELSLPILNEFLKTNQTSDYVTQLEDAIARGYMKQGKLALAERYGMQAHNRAKSENMVQLMEKTSDTMASIKRAQGQLASALEYYDINLALKKKVLDEQLHKNLAYQRVKFDVQDKANQLALSEQKNKNLNVEKALQQGRNQNLLLFITLGLILLTVLGAWLAKTWQQKNQFRTSSQTDGLTQVSNRAHFMACAMHAFKDARIEVSVVLFDMDFFKKINDAFGHAAGDWVLKTVCDVVKTQLRKSDVLGRLGGEEFALCLVGMAPEEVLVLAERCRVAIAAVDTTPSGFIFDITASFGIATRPAHALSTFEEVLAAADKALYLSKNEGRNRVSVYQ